MGVRRKRIKTYAFSSEHALEWIALRASYQKVIDSTPVWNFFPSVLFHCSVDLFRLSSKEVMRIFNRMRRTEYCGLTQYQDRVYQYKLCYIGRSNKRNVLFLF